MSSKSIGNATNTLHAVLAGCRAELAGLYAEVAADGAKKMRRWQDESPMLESYIQAMTGTREILQRETKQMTAEIANLKAFLDRKAAAEAAKQDPALAGSDIANLQGALSELQSKLAELDQQLKELVAQLAEGQAAVRPEERSIHETKLVVLQDTRRLLQSEAAAVSAELKRRESAARLESDKHSAAELGLSDLGRLTEQLAATEAKLDRAKLDSYFPKIKGFRFSGGGNGVYFACKDMHLCEVSAAFSLELEAAPAQQQQQQQVRLKVSLSGISSSSSGHEFKQQQHAHEQQQQAKAAARANSLKRMQPQQQQPALLCRSGSSSAAQQQQQQQQQQQKQASATSNGNAVSDSQSPVKQPVGSSTAAAALPQANGSNPAGAAAAAPGGVLGQAGSSSSSRRGAAVAKFIGKLSDKRDSLKQAIKAASDDGGMGAQSAPQGNQRIAPQPGQAFSRLAGPFSDKAAAFGERVAHHAGPLDSSSELSTAGADASASDFASLGLASEGTAGTISREGSAVAAAAAAAARLWSESASSDVLQSAAAAATPRGDAAASTSNAAAAAAAGAAGGGGGASAAYPSVSRSSSNASSSSGQRCSAEFVAAESPATPSRLAGRPGSGAMPAVGLAGAAAGSSPGSSGVGSEDGQFKARFQGMKGKLGGLLTDSKQKLADSKQKLQQSKLLNESKAAAKHLLADSKVLLEEGKAGLKTKLADSKVLLEEGKAGFKTKLSEISSKLDEHLHHQQHAEQQQAAQQQWEQFQLLQQQQAIQPQQQQRQQRHEELQSPAATEVQAAAVCAELKTTESSASVQTLAIDGQQQQQQETDILDPASGGAAPAQQQQQQRQPPLSSGSAAEAAAPEQAPGASSTVPTPPPAADPAAGACSPEVVKPEQQQQQQQQQQQRASLEAAAAAPFPGVAAAAAAAASNGDLDRQLLDAAWPEHEAAATATAAGGSAAAAGGAKGSAASAAAGGGRRGVVVMLLAEGLEVIGEKGTKVPNIRAAQLGLEVEACLSASLTYSPLLGWQSAGLSFEVLSLERQVQGSNLPLPKTLIKSLLNMVMPSVFTKLLLTSLPHELGKFILDSAAAAANSSSSSSSSKPAGVWLAGEVSLAGPPIACLSANLTRTSGDVPRGKADIREFVKELRLAQKARALLDLPELQHAKALALLLNPGPYSLLPGASGFSSSPNQGSAAAAAAGSGSNPGSVSVNGGAVVDSSGLIAADLGSGVSITLNDLCRFYLAYSDSTAWERVCSVWQAAADAVCLQLAEEEGLLSTDNSAAASSNSSNGSNGSSSSSSRAVSFDFAALMSGRVAGLVRKPVRLSCGLRQLLLSLDVGAGLAAARDYCERAAKEFAENAKGEDALLLLQRPLSMQLELLHLWHAALSAQLTAFAQQFRGAGGRLLLAADRAGFSVAAESCSYEGPLRVEVPLPLLVDLSAGSCAWELALPDPRAAVPTLASKIRFVAAALAKAAFGTCEDEQEALREAAAAEALAAIEAAGDNGHNIQVPSTQASELEALLAAWSQQALQQQHQQGGKSSGSSSSAGLLLRHGSSLPRSNSSSIAPLLLATDGIDNSKLQRLAGAAAVGSAAAAGEGSGCVGSSGSIGRVSLSRLSLGLVLDERRLKELLAGGIQDANLVGGLLGCFGQLFTATLSPGWQSNAAAAAAAVDPLSRSSSSASTAAAATAAAADGVTPAASAAAAEQKSDHQEPCGMLSVRNNDVTRVRAELESASFVSAVPPRIAVRLLHIAALAVVLKFLSSSSNDGSGSSSSKRLEYVNKVFGHIAEYLGRDCLDLLLCLDVAAAASEAGGLQVSVQGVSPSAAAANNSSSNAAGAAASSSSSPSWPVYVINDVNLLTVLDTVKLIMDYSS